MSNPSTGRQASRSESASALCRRPVFCITSVIASAAKQSSLSANTPLACFGALAMTIQVSRRQHEGQSRNTRRSARGMSLDVARDERLSVTSPSAKRQQQSPADQHDQQGFIVLSNAVRSRQATGAQHCRAPASLIGRQRAPRYCRRLQPLASLRQLLLPVLLAAPLASPSAPDNRRACLPHPAAC